MVTSAVSIDCDLILDEESFHSEFARILGFPDFYGRNMNAWIDCLTSVDVPEDGMSSVHCEKGSVLTIELKNVLPFKKRCPTIYAALIECGAFVNWRRIEVGEQSVLAFSFRN